MNKILVPEQLKKSLNGQESLELELTNIRDLIDYISFNFPQAKDRLFRDGGFNKFVNVYVNGEDIRFLDSINTAVRDGDEISIVPALAGG